MKVILETVLATDLDCGSSHSVGEAQVLVEGLDDFNLQGSNY